MTRSEQYYAYWDDGNKNNYPWFRKGKSKRIGRKKYIRFILKQIDLE